MKVSTTSDRLKQLISERKLKQVDILDACKPFSDKYGIKITKSDLSQYISGRVQPKQDKLSILARALGVSEIWLMGYNEPSNNPTTHTGTMSHKGKWSFSADEIIPDNIMPMPEMKLIPLIGTIACGEPITAEENISERIPVPANIDADFSLRCKGDSMINARIFDGDIVFVKSMPLVENGDIAAVLIDGEATLKKVYYFPDDNRLVLRPCNPMYSDMIYTNEELDEIRILGKAIIFQSYVKG